MPPAWFDLGYLGPQAGVLQIEPPFACYFTHLTIPINVENGVDFKKISQKTNFFKECAKYKKSDKIMNKQERKRFFVVSAVSGRSNFCKTKLLI